MQPPTGGHERLRTVSGATDLLLPGTPVDLSTCAREPIHAPGAIQSHGALLVGRRRDHSVVQVSANLGDFLPGAAAGVLGHDLADVLGGTALERLLEQRQARERGWGGVPVRLEVGDTALDATLVPSDHRLLVVELEVAADPEQSGDLVRRIAGWIGDLQSRSSVEDVLTAAVDILRALSGFDRGWAYRFEDDGHGVIVAESRSVGIESYLGLHFPEGDIPSQARDLFARNAVRVIGDVAAPPAALEPLVNPETGEWLDLSDAQSRAVSPMHLRYLANMGVRASMSVPIVVDGRLWGLLSAHHYDGPRRLSAAGRTACQLLGLICATQVTAKAQLGEAHARMRIDQALSRVVDAVVVNPAICSGLAADPGALLGVCDATGAIVNVAGERLLVGETPGGDGPDRLLAALSSGDAEEVIVTEHLSLDHPELADLAEQVSGALAIPLSRAQGNWVVWLRPELPQEVTWGNRDKELVRREPDGTLRLGERESFERWVEQVEGRSRPWTRAQVEGVRRLRGALGTLVISRTEEMSRANADLARANAELDSFAHTAAHDLREPLRGIGRYADILMEDAADRLDGAEVDHLQRIQKLCYRMGGLLSSLLEYARIGQAALDPQPIDLRTIMGEVRDMVADRIADSEAVLQVADTSFTGDPDAARSVLVNLVSNAIKYSDGPPRIEVGVVPLSIAEGSVRRVRRSLRGEQEPPVLFVRDQGLGIAPRDHAQIFELFRRLHGAEERGGGAGAGLALCRRAVERHGGTIWVVSELGRGSTFYFTLEPA